MNLLMRFCELNGEKILIDGVSIADIAHRSLHEFIGLVPQDIWTFEGSIRENIVYSKGHRQLITIARAMAKDSPILILDEATSSVDTRTEKIIQAALDKLMAGRTSFIIAHRLSTMSLY